MENAEINNIIKIVGLQYKKNYEDQESLKTLRYGKIMIMTDQVRFTKTENREKKNTLVLEYRGKKKTVPFSHCLCCTEFSVFVAFIIYILVGHNVFSATKQNR